MFGFCAITALAFALVCTAFPKDQLQFNQYGDIVFLVQMNFKLI